MVAGVKVATNSSHSVHDGILMFTDSPSLLLVCGPTKSCSTGTKWRLSQPLKLLLLPENAGCFLHLPGDL